MAKPEQAVLIIEPHAELKFEGPFNLPVVSFIKLINDSDKKIHFKLKTTAPKKYCVRPNSGVLAAKSKIEVQVVLQPFIFNAAEKHKHKFMVQFMVEPEGERIMTPDELWKCIAPDKIMNYKLKCVFEQPCLPGNETQGPTPDNVDTTAADEKIKKIVDNNKTTSKPTLMGNGGELQKVAAEVKQLREEESKLRQENIGLKEEISRLRQKSGKDSERHSYSPPAYQLGSPDTSGPVPMTYIAAAVLIAIFSFLFGKFFN
ncbi:vesicle-associated membrane protein-associated protein A-like [Arctopsyche grandis]|uniref:vesicle-associated membrane protein-associated protein A-like n=1 Tax=Arctopsyche grandis TaxID=121162 RepID=UPI00406D7543